MLLPWNCFAVLGVYKKESNAVSGWILLLLLLSLILKTWSCSFY